MDMFFILKSMARIERHKSGVCVKGSTSNEFEVGYYGKLEEVIELKYHNEQNRVFFHMLLVRYHRQRNHSRSLSWFGRN